MVLPSLHVQAGQHRAQPQVALFKVGHRRHHLLVSHMAAGLLQLDRQVRQLLGVGGVVAHHILHQRQQLLHGGVGAGGLAPGAAGGALVAVLMGLAVGVEMVMVMGMGMLMAVDMGMLVAVGHPVVGVLVGMGMTMVVDVDALLAVIVIEMHMDRSFGFFYYYTRRRGICQRLSQRHKKERPRLALLPSHLALPLGVSKAKSR